MSNFDNQTVYLVHNQDSDSCGCGCPPGLVSVKDNCGNHSGCLTPNDASCYIIESHIPEIGYVKVFDPRTGDYVGDMLPADAITYLTYLETLPVELKFELDTKDVLCNGESNGQAELIVSGGSSPYVIDWAGADPMALAAGSYMVTVTDNVGNSKVQTFIISEPPVLTATSSSTPDTGGGVGTATVEPSGGVAPYTYLWDDSGAQTTQTATGLTAGDYNCTITDFNGCVLVEGPVTVV